MSMLGAVKNAVFGQAMRLMSDPPSVQGGVRPARMDAAMKAMSLGGTVKAELDKASRLAAGIFGLATQEEVTALRTTIQTLEDTVAVLESRASGASRTGS